jgi:hypothetical protein
MVVVNEGRNAIGETRAVSIVQVLQTVAGKMIFAELHDAPAPREDRGEQGGRPEEFGGDIFSEKTSYDAPGERRPDAPRNDNTRNDNRQRSDQRNDVPDRSGGGMRRSRRAER